MTLRFVVIPAAAEEPIAELVVEDQDAVYDAVKRAVGGWLEMVMLGDAAALYIDEEGKLKRLAVNRRATELSHRSPTPVMAWDVICGDVVVVGTLDERGRRTGADFSVPEELRELLLGGALR